MIEDPSFWHTWNDKLGVVGLVVGGIIGTVIFLWNWVFIKTFAKHRDLSDCYKKVVEEQRKSERENREAHGHIADKIDDLKNFLLEHMGK